MTTYNTGNPLGSAAAKDLFDNAQNLDNAVNGNEHTWEDRFGKNRRSLAGIDYDASQAMLKYGYITKKSFELGATLETPNTVLQWESDGEFYRWDGDWSQPKVVPAGSTPESTGGIGTGKWLGVGDAALRADLFSSDEGLGDSLIKNRQPFLGSVARSLRGKNSEFISIKDFGAIGDGTLHLLSEMFTTLADAQFIYPFVTSLSQSVDWAATQAALNTGRTVYAPTSDYVINYQLLMRTIGQSFYGDGRGYGYGEKDAWWETYNPQTRFIVTGSYARRIMTRRNARTSSSDANDVAMSAALEIHAEGANVDGFAIWLECDYSDASPTNYGADVDIGVFVSSRCGVTIPDIGIFGYFRKAGFLFDVTRAPGDLPELKDPEGNSLPVGIPFHGGDGTVVTNPYVRGARVALAVVGAVHSDTGYWNDDTGSLVTDTRGASGFSDFRVMNGRLYAGYHHSGYRLANPSVSPLTRAAMEAEDIWAPACLFIDGWSDNASTTSHGVAAIRGMIFFGVRFTTPEIFRVRLRRCDEIYFVGRCWIEGGTGVTYDTSGNVISNTDYTNYTYGHISANDTLTGAVKADSVTGGIFQRWISSGKWAGTNAYGSSRLRGVLNQADSSVIDAQMNALNEIRDLASSPTKFTNLITGFKPSSVLLDVSSGSWAAGWVNDTQFMDLCYASNPANVAALQANRAYRVRLSDNLAQFAIPHQLPSYSVSSLPTNVHTIGAGFVVYCTNGDSGNPCLAVNSGGVWRRVALGSAVSAS